jgi:hypothetical protein
MKRIITLAFMFLIYNSFGQKRTVEKQEKQHSPNLKLSYFGNWNYPGIKLGTEFMLKNSLIKPRKNRSPREKQSFITLNLALYDHFEFRTNAMIQAEYLFRKTYKSGIFADYATGIGLSQKLSKQVPTYLENTNGTISEVKPNNRFTALSFLGGVGYDFEKVKKKPFKIYARTGVVLNIGGFLTAVPVTEFGLSMPLYGFKKK